MSTEAGGAKAVDTGGQMGVAIIRRCFQKLLGCSLMEKSNRDIEGCLRQAAAIP